jgi:hypothetical protein
MIIIANVVINILLLRSSSNSSIHIIRIKKYLNCSMPCVIDVDL